MSGEHKASERRIESAERKRKALELKKAGLSYDEIAVQCGYSSRARAFEAVTRSIRELTQDVAKDVLVLELERLDRLQFGIWEKARGGDLQAIDRVLRIMERRAALVGLDAAAAVAAGLDGTSNPTVDAMTNLVREIRALDASKSPD
jgi:hypothetical protein